MYPWTLEQQFAYSGEVLQITDGPNYITLIQLTMFDEEMFLFYIVLFHFYNIILPVKLLL